MIIYLSPKCLKRVEKVKKTDCFKKTRIETILDKSPWDSTAIFIFFCYFSVLFLLKQCSVFEILLQFSLPPPYTKLKLGKKFWIHASNIVCGVREGVGPVWIGKCPRNAKVSQDFCPWLSEKEVGRNKAILRVFQSFKSVFFGILMKDRNWTNLFPAFPSFSKRDLRIRSKRMIYTGNCGIS